MHDAPPHRPPLREDGPGTHRPVAHGDDRQRRKAHYQQPAVQLFHRYHHGLLPHHAAESAELRMCRFRIDIAKPGTKHSGVRCDGAPQQFADDCRPQRSARHGSREAVDGERLRKHHEGQAALHYGGQEYDGDYDRRRAARRQRYEQHPFLHAVVDEEIEVRQIDGGQREAYGRHRFVSPFSPGEGEIGEAASSHDADEYVQVQVDKVRVVKAEDGAGVLVLHHVLCRYEREEHEVDGRCAHHIAARQRPQAHVGMVQERRPPQVDAETDYPQQHRGAHLGRVPPVEVSAVHAHEREAQHHHAPQRSPYPVDAEQRDIHRRAHRPDEDDCHEHHHGKQARHYPVHVLPAGEECRVHGGYAAELYGAVNHQIHVAEEHRHVAYGRQPQLYGGVAGEGSLHPEPAADEARPHQHRHVRGVGAHRVGSYQHRPRREQLRAVGVAELDAEHNREVHRHAYERRVAGHEDVLAHQRRGAGHVVGGGEIYSAGELHDDDEQDEQPGLQPARHEIGNVRDVERSRRVMPVSHSAASQGILHSFLRAAAPCRPHRCRP